MSNLVNLESVTKAYGLTVLLDAVSLGLAVGERIGVVGRNGAGKSTLLRVVARGEEADAGRVTHVGGLRVAMLSQTDELDPTWTIRQAVLGDRAEHDWASEVKIRDVLTGLFGGLEATGFPAGLDTAIGPLSGGERRRVGLARELIADPDLLILDEPTNHLDVEGIDWLAGHLAARAGALLVVTHDRWFLDAVCTRTWEVADGAVHAYEGGYAAYVLAKAERARIAAATETRRQNLMRKELAWLRRGPPARTSKPRFRIDAANALIADEPPARNSVELARFAAARLGRTVYELEQVTLQMGEKTLLKRVDWALGPGDRVGLVGVNGSGKTSLLRLLTDELAPGAGKVVRGLTVRLAYLSQNVVELDPTDRALASVERVAGTVTLGKKDVSASDLMERFGFVGDRQWAHIGDLSGGERRRLALLRLLMTGPNVLLLDEPTNDLDIETLTQLEDLLDAWPGSLIVVSHDRYFLERTTDTVVALLGDGRIRMLPGGVDEYLTRRHDVAAAQAPAPAPKAVRASVSGDARAARKELVRIERRLDKITSLETDLHAELAEHASDHVKVAALDADLRALLDERTALEEEWLTLAEAAE
ncbi:MAG TPA: ABC-F family ATP-binding cassette domain-containing protein [Sporichthyaceae bacterium]|jgi:ATP-binding cassette subfamily F protein uup